MSTVLIVDDDPSTRFVMRMILETAGHLVTEAEHGAAALARMGTHPPDIVTTDLMMPVLDGKELIERLRSQPTTASIPIVVVSGSPGADLVECIRGLGGKLSAAGAEALAS